MPIISNSGNTPPTHNGEPDIVLLQSMDDEESFVVLERSSANDMGSSNQPSFQPFSNNCSFPVFNNLSSSNMTLQTPTSRQDMVTPDESAGPQFESHNTSVSVEDIQKQLQEVLHENINLKENLFQTNLAMKQQLSTVKLLQDRASEVQKTHQAKFEETKAIILKLNSETTTLQETNSLLTAELNQIITENKELRDSNVALGKETTQLLSENVALKKQVADLQETVKAVVENGRKSSQQPTAKEVELHQLTDQLSRKLEGVERARRQLEFDIDKLQAQLGRASTELTDTQRRLALAENALQIERKKVEQAERQKSEVQISSDTSLAFSEKLSKYDELLKQLKSSAQEEQVRFDSLGSWLATTDPVGNSTQFEITELRNLLAQEQSQSVARKENLQKAVSTIQELLIDFKTIGEQLEMLKADHAVKESHSFAYDELQKKGFIERLDSLTAKLVEKEEALAISERHLASLQEAVRLQNDEKKDAFSFLGICDNGETLALKDQVQKLIGEVAAKEEKLKANNQEVTQLKAEIQELKSTAETIPVLEEQAKIYQADFEVERKARESLVAEKERLLEDLRHLQRRNQELIDTLQNQPPRLHGSNSDPPPASSAPRAQEHESSPPPRPQDDVVPPPKRFTCPNPTCNLMFATLEPLELHVVHCLQLTD